MDQKVLERQQETQRNNLGVYLCQWHSSGSDPIYAAGSSLIAQIDPPIQTLMAAFVGMAQNIVRYKDNPVAEELGHALTTMQMLTEYLTDRTERLCPECGSKEIYDLGDNEYECADGSCGASFEMPTLADLLSK